MQLTLAHIGPKPAKTGEKAAFDSLTRLYLDRIQPYHPIQSQPFPDESALLLWLDKQGKQLTRTPALLILLDSRGRQLSSEDLAAWLTQRRDQGHQHLIFAIGPHNGWSAAVKARAHLTLSFGPITMPHELARLVLAEQLYRACTIAAGHPYHSGH
jgi:23S rRNA (pseudouridine1915-N3)-methyltransferase